MKPNTLNIAVVLGVSACTVPHGVTPVAHSERVGAPPAAPLAVTRAKSDYPLLNARLTGLLRAFDDAHTTTFEFSDRVPVGLMLFDEQGRAVTFSVNGSRVVAGALHRGWLIRTPTQSSYAEGPPTLESDTAAEGPESSAAELAETTHKLKVLEGHLKDIGSALDAGEGKSPTGLSHLKTELQEVQTDLNGVNATLIRGHFASGSATVNLSMSARAALDEAALAADEVDIRGGADSTGPKALNELLAQHRANSVKQVLIEDGVEESKISASAAAGDFVASNATAAGRAENRRVDVLFRSATGEPVRWVVRAQAL